MWCNTFAIRFRSMTTESCNRKRYKTSKLTGFVPLHLSFGIGLAIAGSVMPNARFMSLQKPNYLAELQTTGFPAFHTHDKPLIGS